MYLVRDILYCKPGKVRPMIEKFQTMSKIGKSGGFGSMRVMTDVSAERYWTIVTEVEVPNLQEYEETGKKMMADPKLQEAMKDYHDLVESGRREIYKIEN